MMELLWVSLPVYYVSNSDCMSFIHKIIQLQLHVQEWTSHDSRLRSRPFGTILYWIGFHWGQSGFRLFGQKTTLFSTDRDQIWTTHTRDQGASNVIFSRSQNCPNSEKIRIFNKFSKIHIAITDEFFSPNFQHVSCTMHVTHLHNF